MSAILAGVVNVSENKEDAFGIKERLINANFNENGGLLDANFVITCGTAGCHYDNLQCHQWLQSWHRDDSQFCSVVIISLKASS